MTRFTLYIVPFLFILPLPWSFSSANGLFYRELFYAYTATALSALLILQTVLYRNKENGSFSPLDKVLLLFILLYYRAPYFPRRRTRWQYEIPKRRCPSFSISLDTKNARQKRRTLCHSIVRDCRSHHCHTAIHRMDRKRTCLF